MVLFPFRRCLCVTLRDERVKVNEGRVKQRRERGERLCRDGEGDERAKVKVDRVQREAKRGERTERCCRVAREGREWQHKDTN